MKKNLIAAFSIMLFACILLTGCQKDLPQSIPVENAGEMTDSKVGNNSSCKVTHIVWDNWYTWDFHYNDKGLADEWRIVFDYGYVQNFKMKYDKSGKLIEAPGYDDFNNLIFTNYFAYRGNRIISQKWADLLGGTSGEVLFSYNRKGQIVREDDHSNGTYVLLTYDNMGNSTRSDYYINGDVYYSDIYEFNSHVRNPLLTVSGVDWLFPYYGVGYFNKLWFSRNLSIVYDGGNQYVINDLDASKTDFKTGPQNFPVSVNYYDKVSESPFDYVFGYSCNENCNSANQVYPNSNIGANRTIRRPGPMQLRGSAKSIKEHIAEWVKQIKYEQQNKSMKEQAK